MFSHVIDGKSVVVILLVLVWTGMILLVRAHAKVPARTLRIALTFSAAMTAALLTWSFWIQPQPQPSDLAPVWAGARAVFNHQNPYDVIGPGREFDTKFPLIYPMTAVVTLLPIALLPLRLVDPIFVGLGFGLLTWAITRRKILSPALVVLVSLPALMALQTSQWSPLMTGAALLPVVGWLLVAKPTIGMALFAAVPHWKTAVGCAVFLILSLLIWPGWIADWRAGFASAPHVIAPLVRTGGPLVLLAALKWKRAEARLLLALACVPHTTALYETIPLFLIPQSWLQAWGLWILVLLAYLGQLASGPYDSQMAYWASGAQWIVWLVYLPCLGMVLFRPNEWTALIPTEQTGNGRLEAYARRAYSRLLRQWRFLPAD
jgi:hypothetical protein